MTLTAFMDESGTHGATSNRIIIAGFMAETDAWLAYERELTNLLHRFGIKTFHAKKFRQRSGEFRNWSRGKRARFNSQFLELIDKNLKFGACIALRPEDYNVAYRRNGFPKKAPGDSAYGLCLRLFLFALIGEAKDDPDNWPINLVVEQGHKNQGAAFSVFHEVKAGLYAEYKDVLGSVSSATKLECPPLAAPDSLAYGAYRVSAGHDAHINPNIIPTGPAHPPFVATRVKIKRIEFSLGSLEHFRRELDAQHFLRMRHGQAR